MTKNNIYNKMSNKTMSIWEDTIKLSKIRTFNAEIRTKDGTFLILDGEFGVGISVKVMTSEGPTDLVDGPYILGAPYDGVIIEIIKGKIKQIINPLKNEPTPNPLETPPFLADGAIGIVGGGEMSKQNNETMQKFADNSITTASEGVQTDAKDASGATETVQSDKPAETKVYTIEELSTMMDELMARVAKIEGTETAEDTKPADAEKPTDGTKPVEATTTEQKMSAEVKAEVDRQVKEFFEKNSPSKILDRFDADDNIEIPNDSVMAKVKQLEILRNRKINKK